MGYTVELLLPRAFLALDVLVLRGKRIFEMLIVENLSMMVFYIRIVGACATIRITGFTYFSS